MRLPSRASHVAYAEPGPRGVHAQRHTPAARAAGLPRRYLPFLPQSRKANNAVARFRAM